MTKEHSVDLLLRTRDGRETWLNSTGAPIRDATGQITGGVEVVRDVTERWQLEQRTREALQALVALAEAMVQVQPTPGQTPLTDALPKRPSPGMAGPELFRRLAEVTRSVLGCRRVSLVAVEAHTGWQHPLTVVGLPPDLEQQWWASWSPPQRLEDRFEASVAAAVAGGHPIRVAAQHVRASAWRPLYPTQAGLMTPLEVGGALVGTFLLDYGEQAYGYFFPEERLLIQTVSRLGALVLERERLLRAQAAAQAKEASLRAEQQRLLDLMDLAHDAILVRSPASSILRWNQGAERLYGWTEQEALGQMAHHLLATRFPVSPEVVEASLEAKDQWEGLLTHTRRDGAEVQVESRQVLVRDAADAPAAILEINRDVTEREQLLRQRTEAQAQLLALEEANRRMDEFLSIVSHELRTPITSARGQTQLLKRRLERLLPVRPPQERNPDEQAGLRLALEEGLDRIESQTHRMARLVEDLLDAARLQTGQLALRLDRFECVALVEEVVAEQQVLWPERQFRLRTMTPEALWVETDAERTRQVLTNYLTNALKYAPPPQPIEISVRQQSGQVRVEVCDHGPGIPREELARIWERFRRVPGAEVFSGSGGGLGLGLYLCKALIEGQGGQVGVESLPEHGSTFWFTLPLRLEEESST